MEIKVTNKIYLIASILALSIGSNVLSQGRGAPPASIDTNGNGTVEKSEFSAMHDQRFATMDLDANGISFDEFKAKEMADKSRANTRAIQRNFNSMIVTVTALFLPWNIQWPVLKGLIV